MWRNLRSAFRSNQDELPFRQPSRLRCNAKDLGETSAGCRTSIRSSTKISARRCGSHANWRAITPRSEYISAVRPLTAINMLDEISRVGAGYPTRTAWLLDTYDGFSYAEAFTSSDAMWAGTHSLFGVEKTMRHIDETLSGTAAPRQLVACNVCSDPLPAGISKIAVANIDVDMYEPTLTALTRISDLIVPGGIIGLRGSSFDPRALWRVSGRGGIRRLGGRAGTTSSFLRADSISDQANLIERQSRRRTRYAGIMRSVAGLGADPRRWRASGRGDTTSSAWRVPRNKGASDPNR